MLKEVVHSVTTASQHGHNCAENVRRRNSLCGLCNKWHRLSARVVGVGLGDGCVISQLLSTLRPVNKCAYYPIVLAR
jgi:hypothetical protein